MAGSDKIGHHSELTPLTQDCGLLTIFAKAHTSNPWGETSLWVLNSLWKKKKETYQNRLHPVQLDTAVSKKRSSQTVCSFHRPPHTLEQHETQTSFSGSHTIWSKKNPCSYHKRLFSTLSIGFIGSISPMFELKFVAVHENLWKIWVEMDALRNGPLFGNSLLCSAGNARRLSIISTGNLLCCARLRANGVGNNEN